MAVCDIHLSWAIRERCGKTSCAFDQASLQLFGEMMMRKLAKDSDSQCVISFICERPTPSVATQALPSFLNEPFWVSSRPQGPHTSWLQVVLEFLAISFSFHGRVLSPG